MLLEIPMGKPQTGRLSWLVGAPALAELCRHLEDAVANSSKTSSGSFTTLFHPSCHLGKGRIASNDSVSTAMAKSSVILPWPGTASVLGKGCFW